MEMNKDSILVCTQHDGLIEWLAKRGIVGKVVSRARMADVRDKIVFGVLPLRLAAQALCVYSVEVPGVPVDKLGVDLTADEMTLYGAIVVKYTVATERVDVKSLLTNNA